MILVQGYWYDGKSSARQEARLQRRGGDRILVEPIQQKGTCFSGSLAEVRISPRLGNTPRYIEFPSGARFETRDNDAIDQLLEGAGGKVSLVHRLESRKRFVFATLVAVLAFIWLSVQFGIPALSKRAANWVPAQIVNFVSQQTMAALDATHFEATRLDSEVRDRVHTRFQLVIDQNRPLDIVVQFRFSESLGPNAFALPNGTIVFTDDMVRLAANDDELVSVLVHEIGHVHHQHGLRRLIQDSLLAFLLATVAGDISGTSEVFLGLPLLLTEMAYSRGFELEADQYAVNYLEKAGLSAKLFADLMNRLERAVFCSAEELDCTVPDDGSALGGYFSTHPRMKERLEAFKQQ